MLKSTANRLKQFTACTNGNAGVFFATFALPIVVLSGSAIDFGNYTNAKTRAQAALDAGTLAVASAVHNDENLTTQEIEAAKEAGRKQFYATLGTVNGSDFNEPVFDYDPETFTADGTLTGGMNNKFVSLVGVSDFEMTIKSQAVSGFEETVGSDLEVSVMLDVTGSMCNNNSAPCTSGTKITAMKNAAKNLVDNVVWADQSKNTSKLAIVPFAPRVRLATNGNAGGMFTAATGMPATWSGFVGYTDVRVTQATTQNQCKLYTNWIWSNNKCYQRTGKAVTLKAKPCVTERMNWNGNNYAFENSDAAPGNTKYSNGNDGTRRPVSWDSGTYAVTPNGATKWTYMTSNPAGYSSTGNCDGAAAYDSSTSSSNYIENANTVVPLSSDATMLKSKIDGLVGRGGTAGALGTAYAWYALSPNWASVWGPDSAPQPYSELATPDEEGAKPNLYKIAVLMTDGEYNTMLGGDEINGSNVSVSMVENNAKALCTGMKNAGIEIYTVGFELPSNSSGKSMLQHCATDAEHFMEANSAQALEDAFEEIGKRIKSKAGKDIRLAR